MKRKRLYDPDRAELTDYGMKVQTAANKKLRRLVQTLYRQFPDVDQADFSRLIHRDLDFQEVMERLVRRW